MSQITGRPRVALTPDDEGRPAGSRKGGPETRKPSVVARRWQRFYSGLRRDMQRNQPLVMFIALFGALLALYGIWASGLVTHTAQAAVSGSETLLAQAGVRVETVTVRGRTQTEEADVIAALGEVQDTRLLDFDANAARVRVEALAWVKRAHVMRLLPNRIHVDLEERTAFAIWQRRGSFVLIDREGVELDMLSSETIDQFASLPHVVGEGANAHAAELLDGLEDAPALKSRLRAASRIGDRRWNLRLDNGIDVRLPDTGVDRAIRDIAALDAEHRLLARRLSVIDLRVPDMLVVRPAEDGDRDAAAGFESQWRRDRRIVVEDDAA